MCKGFRWNGSMGWRGLLVRGMLVYIVNSPSKGLSSRAILGFDRRV